MKFQSLESFRGLAALAVALYHTPFVTGEKFALFAFADVFVDFFFILSGFVICFSYADRIQNGYRFHKFFLLRLGRIYPLHLVMLLVWVPYIFIKAYLYFNMGIGSTNPFDSNDLPSFISNLFLLNSLGLHDFLSWDFPAWSISVEFYTYFIFFGFVAMVGRYANAALMALVSVLTYVALFYLSDNTLMRTVDIGILRCVAGFFFGATLYKLSKIKSFSLSTTWCTLIEIVSIVIMLDLVHYSNNQKLMQLFAFASFGWVIYFFSQQQQGLVSQLLTRKIMLFIGTLSYSIYMTHALAFVVAGNFWQYILKMPPSYIDLGGPELSTVYNTAWAIPINASILLGVILVSYITYTYIEIPWRNKFRTWVGRLK